MSIHQRMDEHEQERTGKSEQQHSYSSKQK
jgi:hypothetical protein